MNMLRNIDITFVDDIIWRYWIVTTVLIVAVLCDVEHSYSVVVLLNVIQVVHFIAREGSVTAFPVQVRTAYLALLIISQAPYMIWVLWWQLIGTAAMVLFKYCFLARLMSLMPWNKNEKYSFDLVRRTFLTAPTDGNVMHGLSANA